jgi:hypothetical protein
MRELDARRAVLDHVLAVVAGSHLVDHLVLRGSRLLQAWAGTAAREPADLDWIVVGPVVAPGPLVVASPYGDLSDLVEEWPQLEVSRPCEVRWWDVDEPTGTEDHRLDAWAQMDAWEDEEPDWVADRIGGLDWTVVDGPGGDPVDAGHPYQELLELLAERPVAVPGVVLEAAKAERTDEWTYAYQPTGDFWSEGVPGVRVRLPYQADGLPGGSVQLDFSYDEWLPEPSVHTRIPRTGGGHGPEIVVRAVGPEVSLAWKRDWLERDRREGGEALAKDVCDVELLERLLASMPEWW